MPWSYRRSVKFGPVRLNVSKRGVGYSVGSKHFRFGKTATGRSYVSSSPVRGLRYQQTLTPGKGAPGRAIPAPPMYPTSQPLLPPVGASLRRDTATQTYGTEAAYRTHAAAMERDGWRIMASQQAGQIAAVTWYRDVPATAPPPTIRPAPMRAGMHPLAIAGIVIVALFLLGSISSIGKSGARPTAALPAGNVPAAQAPTVGVQVGATNVSAANVSATLTAVPTFAPTAMAAPTAVPQVVRIKDNPANVRASADLDGPVIATLAVDTDLSALGPDVTGTDGATRCVPVAANGKNGYVRSDLVTERRAYVAPTATPRVPTASPSATLGATTATTATNPPPAAVVQAPYQSTGGCPPDKPVYVSGYTTNAGKVVRAYCRSR